jgi:hypothetical protein
MFRPFVSVVLATAVFAAPPPAFAEQRTMTRAIEAATLHNGPLDMVAYFVPRPDDLLEVTATFAPRHVDGAPFAPMRIVMGLADGDRTAFAMPGYPEALYGFARSGDEVTVSVTTGALSAAADF